MINNPVISISGPTASGKTKFSIELAKAINKDGMSAVVVNFDSLIFYKELTIGTAKPTLEERDGIDHRLIDISSAKDPINASDYVELAKQEINKIHNEGKVPILVGGSGFYLRALIKGMYEAVTPSIELKEKIDTLFKEKGITPFIEELRAKDPETLERLHENDHYRLIRAVEYLWITGTPISKARDEMEEKNPYDLSTSIHDWNCFNVFLDLNKDKHYEIVQKRTREMVENGLVEEVESLLNSGFTGEEKPLLSIGYKETQEYLKGLFDSKDDYIERISISTRQLAKSQRTWYKKITPKKTYNPLNDLDHFISDVMNFIKQL